MSPSRPIHLAFVWRLHQPWSLSPDSGSLTLPWVRLHAASTYRDFASLLESHPDLRMTAVLSPPLLEQIRLLRDGVEDTGLALTRIPAEELTPEERGMLARYFFSVHRQARLHPLPRYRELLEKRGHHGTGRGWSASAAHLSVDELRDLQVLFNLAWLGPTAAEDPRVQSLMARGRDFEEADKEVVIGRQRELLEGLVPAWTALGHRGTVEWIPCPHRYPILPLLVDSHTARRPTPDARLPRRFANPGDAVEQMARARSAYVKEVGWEPRGLWPPELAVSPECVRLAAEQGFRYLVSDASVLFHSLDERGSSPGRRRLFQPYKHGGCALFFRHAELSRRVAREYSSWEDPDAAADDFIEQVRQAAAGARVDGDAPPLVVVALPLERVWERYPEPMSGFLGSLFCRLSGGGDVVTTSLGQWLDRYPPAVALDHLHSGSWVDGNFTTWIGEALKNRAWDLLGNARERLARAERAGEASAEQRAEALGHLLDAEGADWFWWMGEPYHSEEDDLYEALFRAHLAAAYRALGDAPPAEQFRPLTQGGAVAPSRQPTELVHPRLDGRRASYFEWRGAGHHRVPPAGSLAPYPSILSGLYWGFDPGRLYVRLVPADNLPPHLSPLTGALRVNLLLTENGRRIKASLEIHPEPRLLLAHGPPDGAEVELGQTQEVVVGELIEFAIPLSKIALTPGQQVGLSVQFSQEGQPVSTVPSSGFIEVEVPKDGYETGESFKI